MEDPVLQKLHPEKYFPLVHALFGDDCLLALCTLRGDPIWTSDPSKYAQLAGLTSELNYTSFRFTILTSGAHRRDIDNQSVLYQPIRGDSAAEIGYVVVMTNTSNLEPPKVTIESVEQTLQALGNCVMEDYRLQQEIVSISSELSRRNEEINLLYRTEGQLRDSGHHKIQDVLHLVLAECVTSLDIDLATLIVPERGLYIKRASRSQVSRALDAQSKQLGSVLYRAVVSNKDRLVINEVSELRRLHADFEVPCKIIAWPVYDTKSGIGGVVVMLNRYDKPDFCGNDYQLIEAVAGKITKILQSGRDKLTGLLNRQGFELRLEQAIATSKEYQLQHVLIYLDVHELKIVNNTSGRVAGDELLRQLAVVLKSKTRDADGLARLGNDEFAVLLEGCPLDEAERIGKELCQMLKHYRFIRNRRSFDIGVSIGVAPITDRISNSMDWLSAAAMASYLARAQGRNRLHVYKDGDTALAQQHHEMEWIPRINQAIAEDRFRLYCQPIAPLVVQEQQHVHYEILTRLLDDKGNAVLPSKFIPAAERYHRMPYIDRWVISKTFSVLTQVQFTLHGQPILCAINLSGHSLCDENFLEFVINELKGSRTPPECVCFEITETAAIENLTSALHFISTLKRLGCRFSLDDFGSGLSSFAYLKNLPVDYLKIDGCFVKDMARDPISQTIVESINRLGHLMGMETIAEHVENDRVLRKLTAFGVNYGQGYLLGKPRPLTDELEPPSKERSSQSCDPEPLGPKLRQRR